MMLEDLRLIDKYSMILGSHLVDKLLSQYKEIYSDIQVSSNYIGGDNISLINSNELGFIDVLHADIPEEYVIKYEAIDIMNDDLEYSGIRVLKCVYDYEAMEDSIGSSHFFKRVGSGVIEDINSGNIGEDLGILLRGYSDIVLNKNLALKAVELGIIKE